MSRRRHLRSAKALALLDVMKAARKPRHDPEYVSQRDLASYLGLTQSGYGQMETGERGLDVLDFIDLGDAHFSDRLALFRALIQRCPRRVKPIRQSRQWRAAAKIRSSKRKTVDTNAPSTPARSRGRARKARAGA